MRLGELFLDRNAWFVQPTERFAILGMYVASQVRLRAEAKGIYD